MSNTGMEKLSVSSTISLPECDKRLNALLGNEALLGDARNSNETPVGFVSPDVLSGWSSLYMMPVSAINKEIQQNKLFPQEFSAYIKDDGEEIKASGTIEACKILQGSAGSNLKMLFTVKNGTLETKEKTSNIDNVSFTLQINLRSRNGENEMIPPLSVINFSDGTGLFERAMLRILLEQWGKEHMQKLLGTLGCLPRFSNDSVSFACMDTDNPDTDKIGILTSDDSDMKNKQLILPVAEEVSDYVLMINSESEMCKSILPQMPLFQCYKDTKLTQNSDGFLAEGFQWGGLEVHHCRVEVLPKIKIELDVSATLSSGICVHVVLNLTYDIFAKKGDMKFNFNRSENSAVTHYADIPANMEISENEQKEIMDAAEKILKRILHQQEV